METSILRNPVAALTTAVALLPLAILRSETAPKSGSDEQSNVLRTVNLALNGCTAATRTRMTEAIYRINRDMLKETPESDRKTVLAEVFATIPEFALPTVADGFARDFFCRKAARFTDTDDSFADFAISTTFRIYRRCRELDLTGQRRIVFAVVMFLKASEGEPPDLQARLEAFIPDSIRDEARDVWIPSALGEPGRKDFKPLIAPELCGLEDGIGAHDSGMAILPWAQFDNKGVPPRIFGESQPGKKEGEKLP